VTGRTRQDRADPDAPAGAVPRAGWRARLAKARRELGPAARRNWLAVALLATGLALRVLALAAYRPALLYVDSLKYLYNAYPGSDPLGYELPLKAILAVGNLTVVVGVQHLLGLAMAVVIYGLLRRRQVPRWLAALAIAPVLLDAYQVQIEQNIMPDVWFEALIVAGAAALLARPAPAARAVILAGLLLGASATVRQVGEILVVPGVAFLLAAAAGWQAAFQRAFEFVVAFAVPVAGYMIGSYVITGHLWLASATPSLSSYGRMATAADCATLRIPAYERPLCPTARERRYGIDWLDHDSRSPLKSYVAPPGMQRYAVIANFDHQVAEQQPGRVLGAIAADGAHLFALTRTASQDGTPISRWQFQDSYPTFGTWVRVRPDGLIMLGLYLRPGGGPEVTRPLDPGYGGRASVIRPIAAFLRAYQLGGGYTPGPLMAVFALAGLAGSLRLVIRRPSGPRRGQAQACLLFFGCAAAVLAVSDAFQFTWRYQLPALVTLPAAGALGAMALMPRAAGRPATEGEREPDRPAATPAT